MTALSKYQPFETKILTVPEFYTDESKDWTLSLENAHFSQDFCSIMSEAHEKGYDYVRLTN